MILNAPEVASARRVVPSRARAVCALLAAVTQLAPGAAFAEDRALLGLIGYSADARFFAFEEFGYRQGSGLPYSSIHVLDLSERRSVVGSPISQQGNDSTESVLAVRKSTNLAAESRLADLGIAVPAELAAVSGDGEVDAESDYLTFGTLVPDAIAEVSGRYEVTLETFPVQAGATCDATAAVSPKGFALFVGGHASLREMHRDADLPRARGCPINYRITAIALPFGATDISGAVALVSAYLEEPAGLARRFVAVPLGH